MEFLQRNVSTFGMDLDALITFIHVLAFFWFFVALFVMLFFVLRYRKRPGHKAVYQRGVGKEVWYVLLPVVLVALSDVSIDVATSHVWKTIKGPVEEHVPDPDLEVKITAQQYAWRFEYPGPDKEWGTQDDISSFSVLRVPADRKIVFHLTSRDVLHSFWVKSLRLKQDAIPGRLIRGWFEVSSRLIEPTDWQQNINATDIYHTQVSLMGLQENIAIINNAESLLKKKRADIQDAEERFQAMEKHLISLEGKQKEIIQEIQSAKASQDLLHASHLEVKLQHLSREADHIKRYRKLILEGPGELQNLMTAIRHREDLLKDMHAQLHQTENKLTLMFQDNQLNRRLFEIACAEICGVNHSIMNAWLVIDSAEHIDRWYMRQS